MSIGLILSLAVGFIGIMALTIIPRRSASKVFKKMPDRQLIEKKLLCKSLCRRAIVIQVLLVVLFGIITQFGKAHDSDLSWSVFVLFSFGIVGMRSYFNQMKIAAETELEYRRLHEDKN